MEFFRESRGHCEDDTVMSWIRKALNIYCHPCPKSVCVITAPLCSINKNVSVQYFAYGWKVNRKINGIRGNGNRLFTRYPPHDYHQWLPECLDYKGLFAGCWVVHSM